MVVANDGDGYGDAMKDVKHGVSCCMSCGVEIDDEMFPCYCMDCFHMLKITGLLPNGLRHQNHSSNGG